MQKMYITKLCELAEMDRNVLHLLADSGTAYDEMFRMYYPEQMLDFGIAEEHMAAAAAGLALMGKVPFIYTTGAFLAYRSLEFIRNDICFQNLNVKLAGMGSGLSWSTLGPTHHTTEDISVLRAMPNLKLLSPATPVQLSACVEEAYREDGPVYIRMGMSGHKEFFDKQYGMPKSGQDILLDGKDAVVFVTGNILESVMEAAEMLLAENIKITVVNVVRLKPFDENALIEQMGNARFVVTAEEHNIYGGLGGIVSEAMAKHGIGKKLIRLGLEDMFARGYSKDLPGIWQSNHLDPESIAMRIRQASR